MGPPFLRPLTAFKMCMAGIANHPVDSLTMASVPKEMEARPHGSEREHLTAVVKLSAAGHCFHEGSPHFGC